jgi:glycosyltransferase involved in cell wall biosynthesis
MVIDCPSAKALPIRKDWYPHATWIKGLPTPHDWQRWMQGLDVVFSAETFYGQHAFRIARNMGVKTVLQANFEFLDRQDQPTLWAAPSLWRYNEWPNPKIHLPVPVETEHFTPTTATRASHFLHIVGRPAVHDRAGTIDTLRALQNVQHTDITVTITSQEPGYIRSLMLTAGIKLPDNIDLHIREGDRADYWDLYTDQHVLIAPRRFGGLSLPMQEAVAAGMPVISTAVSPQKNWLPPEWLVAASPAGEFHAKQLIDLWTADHIALAEKISRFANNPVFYRQASEQAVAIAKSLSWSELKPLYEQVLAR